MYYLLMHRLENTHLNHDLLKISSLNESFVKCIDKTKNASIEIKMGLKNRPFDDAL